MKMDGEIRVATDARYKGIYNTLKKLNVIEDSHNLFHVCACLAYHRNLRSPIPNKNREDRFWSRTITPSEWVCYYSMILNEYNFDYQMIKNDKDVILVIEEYANAGMEILLKELLHDYLSKNSSNSDPRIDPTIGKELPKDILNYLYDIIISED